MQDCDHSGRSDDSGRHGNKCFTAKPRGCHRPSSEPLSLLALGLWCSSLHPLIHQYEPKIFHDLLASNGGGHPGPAGAWLCGRLHAPVDCYLPNILPKHTYDTDLRGHHPAVRCSVNKRPGRTSGPAALCRGLTNCPKAVRAIYIASAMLIQDEVLLAPQ